MDEKEKRTKTTIKTKSTVSDLLRPTKSEIKRYLNIWEKDKNYSESEKALKKLFRNYQSNINIEDILIKIYILNNVYNTNIFWPIDVANNILYMNIDDDLLEGNISVVDKIAKKGGKEKFEFLRKDKNGNIKKIKYSFYSFATKYTSFSQPNKYPIFDSNVERALKYFKKHYSDFTFNNTDLRVYKTFVDIIQRFQKVFDLQIFSFRDIDKYLYLVGKDIKKKNKRERKSL